MTPMNNTGVNVIFRDLLLGLLGIVIMFLLVAILQISSQKKTADKQKPPGNIVAFISWPPGDTDVDLWVTGPGEPHAIGYSNKGGVLWNLLRDDLGKQPDITGMNMESSYSRGAPAGEYIFNIHCYRCPQLPVTVNVEIRINTDMTGGGGEKLLTTATIDLTANKQELTAVRFVLDKDGNIVPNSLNSVYVPLQPYGGR
jgi:hypothetical protein